jgi:arylsulfatase A-like enzyme|tara:strand:+ start:631 stop:2199 length:1569 start_codon:yes stop_codon:yes gene_type:complete
MKKVAIFLLGMICLFPLTSPGSGETRVKRNPNVIFILIDDMGWTGTSVLVHKGYSKSKSDYYRTPNLEKLAAKGMIFSNAYAPSPMCTPSRASFLTGKSPAQLHITTPGPVQKAQPYRKVIPPAHITALPEEETTIAEVLKEKGYATAHFGKWHLSGGGPANHGFDVHDGETGNGGPGQFEDPNPKDIYGMTKRANAFMEKQAKAEKPFYIHLAHYAVHSPVLFNEKSLDLFQKEPKGNRHTSAEYAAMTWDLDLSVGRILDKIESLGIRDNTYVIFMSDNGAGLKKSRKENVPLAGGKGSLWEGGIRVPLIVSGPDVKTGAYCDENVVGFDLFPTICDLVGVRIPRRIGIEGSSLAPVLKGARGFKRDRDGIVFHFPHYGKGKSQVPQSALLVGDMKLIRNYETGELLLFDLGRDIGEENNLAEKNPEEASKLDKQMTEYFEEIEAQLPSDNRDYDPSAEKSTKGKDANKFISRLDKDGDGKVSEDEFDGPKRRFDRFDKNGDGVISSDEAPTGPPGGKKK